jgi:hypothetical protein
LIGWHEKPGEGSVGEAGERNRNGAGGDLILVDDRDANDAVLVYCGPGLEICLR